jgi:hypothetical protein
MTDSLPPNQPTSCNPATAKKRWGRSCSVRNVGKYSLLSLLGMILLTGLVTSLPTGCSRSGEIEIKQMEVTSYCPCGSCNEWERGSWKYMKLNFWNRYVTKGKRKGQPYTGKTAGGNDLQPPRPGLFSVDSLKHPWMIPVRIIGFPWLLLPQKGTIAADTRYYPFGSEMYVPDWGWGVVDDHGGVIKGPTRLDIYHTTHRKSNNWGRQHVDVKIIRNE